MNNKIKQAVKLLEQGGVVCFPTNSVFAISCDARNEKAVRRIFDLKGRDKNKPLPVLVKDLSMAKELVIFNDNAMKLADAFWPGLLTIVLEQKVDSGIASCVNQKLTSLGVRVPKNEIALNILKEFNGPIIGTSANISGEDSSTNTKMIEEYFKGDVDMVLDGQCGNSSGSTIVDLSKDKPLILRHGAILEEEIYKILDK